MGQMPFFKCLLCRHELQEICDYLLLIIDVFITDLCPYLMN